MFYGRETWMGYVHVLHIYQSPGWSIIDLVRIIFHSLEILRKFLSRIVPVVSFSVFSVPIEDRNLGFLTPAGNMMGSTRQSFGEYHQGKFHRRSIKPVRFEPSAELWFKNIWMRLVISWTSELVVFKFFSMLKRMLKLCLPCEFPNYDSCFMRHILINLYDSYIKHCILTGPLHRPIPRNRGWHWNSSVRDS